MGQKYAAYNSDGAITGYYDSSDSQPPASVNVVAITDAQWQAAMTSPCNPSTGYTIQSGNLVAPPQPSAAQKLVQCQQAQATRISATCAMAITDGFSSDALGTASTYGSDATDQANLLSIAQAGQGGSLWCANGAGVWGLTSHTTAQIAQVLNDWNKFRQSQQAKYAGLVAQINAATTAAEVQAIVWT